MTIVDNEAALRQACDGAGLDCAEAILLGAHATSVYLLPREGLVARVGRGERARPQAERAVAICRWLAEHKFPAPAPAAVVQPVQVDDETTTFWVYYPQHGRTQPSASALGEIVRQLHSLPAPPLELPDYRPLTLLSDALDASEHLDPDERAWLWDERDRVLDAYARLNSTLGVGFIHGDAYMGNLLIDRTRTLLGDWDEVSVGPRELDLANTYHSRRFGQPDSQIRAFAAGYGRDIADWPGLATLCSLRDLHTLTSFIRRADRGDAKAAAELRFRVRTLRQHDTAARWNSAVPLGAA